MFHRRQIRPCSCVVLIGLMGTGKSSLGRRVAGRLGYDFADTDTLVENRARMPITEIFTTHGEPWFRDRESEVLTTLEGRRSTVIATGGGIVVRPENIPILHRTGMVAWITTDEDVLFKRVSRNRNRPLLLTPDPRATLHELLEARGPLYRAAAGNRVLDNSHLRLDEAADIVIRMLTDYENARPPRC